MYRSVLFLLSAGFLIGLASQAQATGLIANWKFNEAAHSTSMTDSVGGHNGTLVGSDSLTTIAGPYTGGPTALYFNGLSGTSSYVGVPSNASFGGMSYLTLSAWVYLPSNYGNTSPGWEIFSLIGGTTDTNVFQLGTGSRPFKAQPTFYANEGGSSPPSALDTDFLSQATPGHWQLWTGVYTGGDPTTAVDFTYLYINGVLQAWGEEGAPMYNHVYPLIAAPTNGATLNIGGGAGLVPSRDNEFNGGLSDLGLWRSAMTGPFGTSVHDLGPNGIPFNDGHGPTRGTAAGETLAMYNTPTSGYAPLRQYGVAAMDKLFTLYDSANTASEIVVVTGNSTLGWKYVASGLTGGSGIVGQLLNGSYYVQLDANGGGLESAAVLSGDANLDGKVDINDLSRVLTNYDKSSGVAWADGDFNGDGKVDINDLSIVLTNYDHSLGSSAAGIAPVPEPATLAMLAAMLLPMAWAVSRRAKLRAS